MRGRRNRTEDTQPNNSQLATEARLLEQAWDKLQSGLHVYNGLRAAAQRRNQLAGHAIGLHFTPNPRPMLSREQSDARLREALGILEKVQPMLSAKNQDAAALHVSVAIERINAALALR